MDRIDVVLAAAEACGLATARASRPEPTLRTATNAQLIRELRRRLATGAAAGSVPRQRAQVAPVARLG